ncbi:MAG: hypothetical protein HOP16_16875 [Acidobacteria bacterium]|nr:hypothetical protein [Acidobacteriota bacterium]
MGLFVKVYNVAVHSGLDARRAGHARKRRHRIVATGLALLLCHTSPAVAQVGQDVLATYSVKSWVGTDGFLFGDTNAIAQDATGYLWLGTSLGLVRFDGVRFVQWKMDGVPSNIFISAMHASRDGSLWVGLSTGIVRIRNDEAALYTSSEGFRGALVTRIVEDRDGTIWANGAAGVWRFRDDRWEQIGSKQGLPIRSSSALFVDPDGTLWVGTAEGIFRRDAGEDTFQQVTKSLSPATAIGGDSFGSVWTTDPVLTLTALLPGPSLVGWPRQGFGAASDLLHDRRGNLWVATLGQGVLRLRPEGHATHVLAQLTRREGLASSSVRALFEDREGNIWIGLAGGLTRLSERKVTSAVDGEAVSALAVTTDGSIWVGTNAGLARLIDGRQRRYTTDDGLPSAGIRALHAQRDGTLWAATLGGPARLVAGRFIPVRLPDGIRLLRVSGMTSDAEGAVWMTDLDDGLFRFAHGAVMRVDVTGLERPASLFTDRAGRMWVGRLGGGLAVYDRGRLTPQPAAGGPDTGTVTAVHEDSQGRIWLGTTTGLGRFENERFVRQDIEDLASGVLSIVEDDRHQLWIATRAGILRASLAGLSAPNAESPSSSDFQVYDESDGLPGGAVRAFPASVRAVDGSLWFATADGAARIVPESVRESGLRPGIRIETVMADDRPLKLEPQALVPSGTSRIEIQYTRLTLSSRASSRFLYRLDGYDRDWVRAGLGREAVYTNLPPGPYRFHVASRGVGLREEAVLDFVIQPMFYQTTSFTVFVAGLVLLVVSAAWRLRVMHVRRQFQVVFNERARIARELHDTLLQGLFGVALQVDGISTQLETSPEGTKERLDGVRRLVTRYIRETRSSIWLLRSESLEERHLSATLRDAAEALTAGTPVELEFEVSGPVRRLSNEVEGQTLRIVHEAVINVVKHAQATRMQVTLGFQADSLCVRVSDNGCGFDVDWRAHHARWGWGLIGMRERAAQVGARLRVSSTPGKGTEVELVVPTDGL